MVALSRDPNVDEISAAIGLTMILNKLGKHVTAIYSGETPNTLEFLSLSKLLKKIRTHCKILILHFIRTRPTTFAIKLKATMSKSTSPLIRPQFLKLILSFRRVMINVDLVISIDVENAESFDGALSEYGRIMHDATAVNITTNQAGRFAELEWSDPSESSVCEMIVILSGYLDQTEFDQPTATALLTGIVSPLIALVMPAPPLKLCVVSSRLMQAGADQQLISSNIMQPTIPTPADTTPTLSDAPSAPSAPVSLTLRSLHQILHQLHLRLLLTSDKANSTDHNSAELTTAPAATLEPLIPAPSLMPDESAPSLPEISSNSPNMAPNSPDPALVSLEQVVAPQSLTTAGMPPALPMSSPLSLQLQPKLQLKPDLGVSPNSNPNPSPSWSSHSDSICHPSSNGHPRNPNPGLFAATVNYLTRWCYCSECRRASPSYSRLWRNDRPGLMGELQATQNPAALVAPSAPARIDDPTIPEIQFTAPVETQTPTEAPDLGASPSPSPNPSFNWIPVQLKLPVASRLSSVSWSNSTGSYSTGASTSTSSSHRHFS